ncbi:hypothetical protein [Hyphomonas sp.]|uniref:hypothetical protein n=1 Tax=Hyphomonas sp. TaxID=87 RepID=UPI0025B7E8E6|nr:hypothetical protein [Hyphomonas sp.]
MDETGLEANEASSKAKFDAESFAKKLMQPQGNWRLLDDTVFQFNDVYRNFWRNGGDPLSSPFAQGSKESWLVPAMFDKQSRTFNWVALADPHLNSQGAQDYSIDRIVDIISRLHKFFEEDENFNLPDDENFDLPEEFVSLFDDSPHCTEALDIFSRELQNFRRTGCFVTYRNELKSNQPRSEDLFYSFASIYSSYSHPRKHSLEGCFYMALEKFGHSHPEVVEHAIFGQLQNSRIDLTGWKCARDLGDDWKFLLWNGKESETISERRPVGKEKYGYRPCRVELASILSESFLENALMSWMISVDGNELRLSERLEELNHLLLVPIYDVWIGRSGFGCLHAVLLIFVKPPNEQEMFGVVGHSRWEDVYKDKILSRCESFAHELATISLRRALSTPVSPPHDLLSHFLKVLAEIQDWEEAVVYRAGVPCYRYFRDSAPTPERNKPAESYLRVRVPWKLDESMDGGPLGESDKPSGSIAVDEYGDSFMWWTCERQREGGGSRPSFDLWSDYYLPELTGEERGMYQDVSIRFKFPKACRIPREGQQNSRDFLVESYQRQQLDLMRALIPKVRARRAALRNAVSAIMGRNMSHNIGSHVLARYASHKETAIDTERLDPRADFLSYLQRRMDFLAEVSTTDKAYWAQPLSLKQQLGRLNYDQQIQIFGNAAGRFPPLLEYITGKDQMKATVRLSRLDEQGHLADGYVGDFVFSCPGGEVGVHALYVILENIIRNSARHNSEQADMVNIDVIPTDRPDADLIELRIVDTRSLLRKDGTRQGGHTPEGDEVWTRRSRAELAKIWASLTTEEKTKLAFKALPDRINWIIQHEPFLDQDGAPKPEYWGLREIQICAQYLRQVSLSDLENQFHLGGSDAIRTSLKQYPVLQAEPYEFAEGKYCLSYVLHVPKAKLCATISAGDEEKSGWLQGSNSGFTELRLPSEPDEEPNRQSFKADLRNLSGYGFVVYDDNNERVVRWVKRYKHYLPIRCLPKSAVHFDAPDDDDTDTFALLEPLHRAYANLLAALPPERRLAGFAIAAGELPNGEVALGQDARNNWPDPLSCAQKGRLPTWLNHQTGLQAAFWVDHVGQSYLDNLMAALNRHNEIVGEGSHHVGFIGWEGCFSGLPATHVIEALKRGQGWELLAASIPRVVVLDERVQAQAATEFRSLALKKYWEGMRVQVPEKAVCNLDHPTMKSCKDWLEGLSKNQDFLIVHLTILEQLSKDEKLEDAAAAVHQLIRGNPCFEDCVVAVVTGRGVATFGRSVARQEKDAEGEVLRYLPVSAFLEYLVRRPSKLGLMRTLWSASRPEFD